MAGEGQFARGGEDAQARECAIVGWALNENCFAEIHLARDCLHCGGGNAIAIGNYCERIPGEWFGREYVECVEPPLHDVCSLLLPAGPVATRDLDTLQF
jgi:hypothetical protein